MTYPPNLHQQPYHDPQQHSVPPGPMAPQPYPPSPAPYGYAVPVLVPQSPPTSSWAVAAMVTGIVGILAGWCLLGIPCIAAIVLGHVGLAETKNNAKSGKGMAITGLALGYVAAIPAIVLFFLMVVGTAGTAVSSASTP